MCVLGGCVVFRRRNLTTVRLRQEDAHEFFMNLLDFMHTLELKAMEQIYDLSAEWKKKNRAMENTTRTHQIFGGTIRSQVH